MVSKLENRHAEKSLKSPWAQNKIIQTYGVLIHSRRVELALLISHRVSKFTEISWSHFSRFRSNTISSFMGILPPNF